MDLWWKGRTLLRISRSGTGAWLNSVALAHGHIITAVPCRFEEGGCAATCAVLANGVDVVIGVNVYALRVPVPLRDAYPLSEGALLLAASEAHPLWLLRGPLRTPTSITWQRSVTVTSKVDDVAVLATAAAPNAPSPNEVNGDTLVALYEHEDGVLSLHRLASVDPDESDELQSVAPQMHRVACVSLRAFMQDGERPTRAWIHKQISGELAVSLLLPVSQQLCTFVIVGGKDVTRSLKLRELLPAVSACALRCIPSSAGDKHGPFEGSGGFPGLSVGLGGLGANDNLVGDTARSNLKCHFPLFFWLPKQTLQFVVLRKGGQLELRMDGHRLAAISCPNASSILEVESSLGNRFFVHSEVWTAETASCSYAIIPVVLRLILSFSP